MCTDFSRVNHITPFLGNYPKFELQEIELQGDGQRNALNFLDPIFAKANTGLPKGNCPLSVTVARAHAALGALFWQARSWQHLTEFILRTFL
jgi:hypothetical protein